MLEITERLYIGDVVLLRKPHPCGGYEWQITRVGADIGIECLTCHRRVMVPRRQFARQVKRFVKRAPEALAMDKPQPPPQPDPPTA